MVVTAPVTLLLVDVWPLRRTAIDDWFRSPATVWPLLREKLPHVGLSVTAAILTVVAQNRSGAIAPLSDVPLADRLTIAQAKLADASQP